MDFLLEVSFFDPLLTSDGQPYARARYKQIVEEQVSLGYLTKGGVTYQDSERMTPYERELALKTIVKLLDDTRKSQQKALESSHKKVQDPKSRMTSG